MWCGLFKEIYISNNFFVSLISALARSLLFSLFHFSSSITKFCFMPVTVFCYVCFSIRKPYMCFHIQVTKVFEISLMIIFFFLFPAPGWFFVFMFYDVHKLIGYMFLTILENILHYCCSFICFQWFYVTEVFWSIKTLSWNTAVTSLLSTCAHSCETNSCFL